MRPHMTSLNKPFGLYESVYGFESTERPKMVFGPLSPGEMRVYLRLPKMNTGSSSGHRSPKTEDFSGPLFSFFSNFPSSPNFSLFFLSLKSYKRFLLVHQYM